MCYEPFALNGSAVKDDLLYDRGLMAVRNEGKGRHGFRNDKVRLLTDCDRAEYVAYAHGVCCVDRACIEGLLRCEAHPDTSEGHDKPHVSARA